MDYKNKYLKYKTKYLQLKRNNMIGGGKKNILFLFFNGSGLTEKQWFVHPYKDKKFWLERKMKIKKQI